MVHNSGASKAAANYLASRLHVEFSPPPHSLCAFALHPGWVRTRMGRQAARDWGVPEDHPPLSAEESAKKCLGVIEGARIEKEGGGFWGHDGVKMDW
jgi:NAD(P)-dependent dehydrogenase (short-subunit alcohol dehydrogenase family)